MSGGEKIYQCQHEGCVYKAAHTVKTGPSRPWLYLCPTHRNQFHVLQYAETLAVYERSAPRRFRYVGSAF